MVYLKLYKFEFSIVFFSARYLFLEYSPQSKFSPVLLSSFTGIDFILLYTEALLINIYCLNPFFITLCNISTCSSV